MIRPDEDRAGGPSPLAAEAGAARSMRNSALVVPERLSALPAKRRAYALEIYFRECWAEMLEGRSESDVVPRLLDTAVILIKPDGVAARALDPIRLAVEQQGFEVTAGAVVNLDRVMMRELWRYELNLATMQRMAAIDILLTMGPSCLLLLRDRRPNGLVSAAERLRAWKGPARGRRTPGQLRSIVGALHGMLNFVHSVDEPADIVRELGVLLSRAERRRFVHVLLAGGRDDASVDDAVRTCEAAIPAYDLRLHAALDRVQAVLSSIADPIDAGEARRIIAEARERGKCDWEHLFDLLDRSAALYEPWDRAAIAAWCTETDVPGVLPVFGAKLRHRRRRASPTDGAEDRVEIASRLSRA